MFHGFLDTACTAATSWHDAQYNCCRVTLNLDLIAPVIQAADKEQISNQALTEAMLDENHALHDTLDSTVMPLQLLLSCRQLQPDAGVWRG